jgi:porin
MSCVLICVAMTGRSFGADETVSGPSGMTVEASYVSDTLHQAHGGVETGTRNLQRIDLTFEADSGHRGERGTTRFFADLQYNNGSPSGDPSGSIQGVSSIEAEDSLRLYELWIDYELAPGNAAIRFGLLDVNSAFDVVESASLFVNPSHGMAYTLAQSGEQLC